MARPTKKGMDYFPHDTDASNDEKIDALRMLYGNDGYTFYFILLERIYRTVDFELDVSDAETIQILARKVEVTPEKFTEILQTAIKRKCFCPKCYAERGVLTSPGIKNRASTVVNKRQKMASSYQQRQGSTPILASEGVSDAETPPETTVSDELPSREKERKGKKRKGNNTTATQSTSDFNCFWDQYEKKTGSKSNALSLWNKLSTQEQQAAHEAIQKYKTYQPDAQYRKDPERYLKGRLWETEFDIKPNTQMGSPTPQTLPSASQLFRTLL